MRLDELELQFMRLQEGSAYRKHHAPVPTGWAGLDELLGGGYAGGRLIELHGGPSVGKTTMGLCAISEVQQAGGLAAFIDAEHSLDINYAAKLGVDLEDLLVHSPGSGEEALEMAELLAESPGVKLIIVDSVAGLVPLAELNGSFDELRVGHHSRLLAQSMNKLAKRCSESGATVLFLNQMRGGRKATALSENVFRAFCAQRLDVQKAGVLKKNHKTIGNKAKVHVSRNLLAPPNVACELNILYAEYQ